MARRVARMVCHNLLQVVNLLPAVWGLILDRSFRNGPEWLSSRIRRPAVTLRPCIYFSPLKGENICKGVKTAGLAAQKNNKELNKHEHTIHTSKVSSISRQGASLLGLPEAFQHVSERFRFSRLYMRTTADSPSKAITTAYRLLSTAELSGPFRMSLISLMLYCTHMKKVMSVYRNQNLIYGSGIFCTNTVQVHKLLLNPRK